MQAPHPASGSAASRPPAFIAVAVLLALLCTALYVNTLAAPRVGEVDRATFANRALRWHELSAEQLRAALAMPHPVTAVSYGLSFRAGNGDLRSHHVANLALHFANALLVYALARALFRRAGVAAESAPWAAFAAAALFAAHPLQVEAVTWLGQRGVLLAALGSLAALVCHESARAAHARAARIALHAATLVGAAFALGARETALVLPVAIALCEWIDASGRAVRALPLALGAVLAAAIVWLDAGRALALHESLAALPLPGRQSLAHAPALPGALALAVQLAAIAAAVALARRARFASFALLWFVGAHVAEAALAPGALSAEHRNYLALVGPAIAAGQLLFAALPRALGPATALAVGAVTLLGAATHARNEFWRSPDALWDDALSKSPRDVAALLERGALREQRGRGDEALADYRAAVNVDAHSALARERLAAVLGGLGHSGEALPHAQEAVALAPDSADAHAELGRIQAALGQLGPAAESFARALALGGDPVIERELGDTLVRLGRFADALPHFDAAIARDPGDDDARTGAGAALIELARAHDALAYLEPAVESQPNPRYLAHFADALWLLGDADGALEAATMAVRVAPGWPGGASRLVWMLAFTPDAERRDPARALRIADAALKQVGGPDPLLFDARAAALAAAGRFADARADAERAAALAREAGDAALADAIAARAQRYARREVWRELPRPFEASP